MHSNDGVGIEIRESLPADMEALERLYPAAFPDEDLLPLLRELLSEEAGVLSLVALRDGEVVGHIAFTMCGIDGRDEKVNLLAPLAVSPRLHRRGIGSALVKDGVNRLKREGVVMLYVLGDPAYYGRFGFEPDASVAPPYDIPREWQQAWQSMHLDGVKAGFEGRLSVPEPWRHPALWAP